MYTGNIGMRACIFSTGFSIGFLEVDISLLTMPHAHADTACLSQSTQYSVSKASLGHNKTKFRVINPGRRRHVWQYQPMQTS